MSSPSDDRLAELTARAFANYEDFCRAFGVIVDESGNRSLLRFNRVQRRYNANRTPRDIILKGRRQGFTTEACARDVWRFVTRPGERIVVVCQSQTGNPATREVSQIVRPMLDEIRRLGVAVEFGTESMSHWAIPATDSTLQIIECGASEAAAQKKGRAGRFSRVHITEAAFFEHPEQTVNALFEGVPIGHDSEIEIESTPNGDGNWFCRMYREAAAGTSSFRAHFFPWWERNEATIALQPGERVEPTNEREEELVTIHGVSPAQLKWWRHKVSEKGLDLVDQEYPTDPVRCFLVSGRKFFDALAIERMAGQTRAPIDPRALPAAIRDLRWLQVWRLPDSGAERFVIGVDTAEGLGEEGDWSYGTGWGRRRHDHAFTLRSQLRPNPYVDELVRVARFFNNALIVVERNKGMAHIEALERLGYPHVYYDEDEKPGLFTSTATRPVMLEDVAAGVRDGSLTTSDETLIAEMRAFVIEPRTGRPHSPSKGRRKGVGDDGIFSAALAWRAMLVPEQNLAALYGHNTNTSGEHVPPDRGVTTFSEADWATGRGW